MKKKIYLKLAIAIFVLGASKFVFTSRPDITIIGPVVKRDGIGRFACDSFEMLKDNYRLNIKGTCVKKTELSVEIKKAISKNNYSFGKVVLYIKPVWELSKKDIKQLTKIKNQKDKILVAYSMFESSLIPQEGVKILNTYFDLIVVPDEYLVNVYRNSGVTKKITVLPIALNFEELNQYPKKTARQHPFIFTILSSSIYRKNILETVKAFHLAFPDNDNVQLKINSRYSMDATNQDIVRYLIKHSIKNITYNRDTLPTQVYNKLLADTDCLLNVSMGEGFSIQPREAMFLGIPTIVSNNTAQKTICSTNLVYSVESSKEEPALHYFSDTPHGSFFKCEADKIAEAMLDVYNNYDFYLSQSEKCSLWAEQYSIHNLKKSYIDFFDYTNLKKLIAE